MELLIAQLLNGLVYGVLLFLMAAGLSLIFGLMNVVSLAHGSFFMLGAFFGLSIAKYTGSFFTSPTRPGSTLRIAPDRSRCRHPNGPPLSSLPPAAGSAPGPGGRSNTGPSAVKP